MDYHKDFADLCALLNAKGVDYLVIDGYAVAFHGAPRFTGDLDLFVRPDPAQVVRLLEAVNEFGFPASQVAPAYLLEEEQILELGRIPVQIHIMTSISGISWDDAWTSREASQYGGVPLFFIGLEALLTNKAAFGRMKDLADVEALGRKENE